MTMANNQPSSSSRQSSATIQTTIHEAMAKISNQARKRTLLPPRQIRWENEADAHTMPSTSTASSHRTEPSTSKAVKPVSKSSAQQQPRNEPSRTSNTNESILLSNSYARELFFRHTNIKQVVAKKLPERSETTRQKYAPQLYRLYVQDPGQRIREHLHEVRFNTRFHEGLLRMALKVPLTSEQEWNTHKKALAKAGIQKLCFVDMTQDNCVLEYQAKVVRKLQAEFRNWSAKLNKLPSYIIMCQRQRETEDRKFLSLLKHHSSLKDSWPLQPSFVVKKLLQERWLPSGKRSHLIWSVLRFDDDHLNRKYEVGDYSEFRFNVEVDPEELVDCTSQAIDLGSFAVDDERCMTPVNVTSSNRLDEAVTTRSTDIPTGSVPAASPAIKNTPVHANTATQSENVPQNHQSFAVPVSTVREIIQISDDNSAPRTTNRTNSTGGVAGYTLEYVKNFTNIYELVIENYFKSNRDKNVSFSQSKADRVVQKFYNLYADTFARQELPEGVRLLTPQEQREQAAKGPIALVMERLKQTKAELQKNSNDVEKLVVEPSANPMSPPHPPIANQPKPKPRKKDPILRVPCPIRTACISYDSDTSQTLSDPPQQDGDEPNKAANHSIAFVSIGEDNSSQPLQQVQENTPLSEEFLPSASSTQNQLPLHRRRSTPVTATHSHPAATQDPLQLSHTSTTTIPPFHGIVPGESDSTRPTQSQSQPSCSSIPPFQLVNATPDARPMTTIPCSLVSLTNNFTVKQEKLSELPADTSGYENDVEFIPNSDNLIILTDSLPGGNEINFSGYNHSIDAINARVIGILARNEDEPMDEHYLSCTEATTSNSSLEGRSRRPIKVEADPFISPPRIGPYICFEAPRKTHQRKALTAIALAANTKPYICPLNTHMLFLHRVHIQSIRYSTIPTTWSRCGVFQANPLTVHLNPASAGLFSVPVCDQQACLLLTGMSAGGKGTEALLAALAHVGKFRYGYKEPEREYYRLSITEKVLYLFFATVPLCPQDGGLVMFPRRKSNVPADGDEMWFERFNYYAHVKPNQRPGSETGGESLAKLLMPGIGRRMKDLREKLLNNNKTSSAIGERCSLKQTL